MIFLTTKENVSARILSFSFQAKFFEPEETKQVGTNCGNLSFPQLAPVTVKEEYHIDEITKEECQQIEEKTRDQINSTLWVEERKGRITASKFGMILKRKHVTEKFLGSLINPTSFTSAQTSYGVNNEKTAIQNYIKESGNHVHDCGLVVNPKFPFLGATPDGKVCEDGVTGLIEVKCPYSARDLTVEEASRTKSFYLKNNSGTITLKKKHDYYHQVQGQLMVTGAEFCDFVVYTRKDLFIQRIFADVEFMQSMLDDLTDFYFKHFKSALCVKINV